MKNTSSLLLSTLFLFLSFVPTSAFFDEDVTEIVEETNSEKVENISATPESGTVILIWNTKKNSNGEEAEKYRIEYGSISVGAGMATEYEFSKVTSDNLPTTKIEGLKNGTRYFFNVIALFSDGSETEKSDEVSAIPLGEEESTPASGVSLLSAEALDGETIHLIFSTEILLPEEDVQDLFFVTTGLTDSESLEVFSVAYFQNPETEQEIKKEIVIKTAQQVPEQEYKITVSTQVSDAEGNTIIAGKNDSLSFVGGKISSENTENFAEEITPELVSPEMEKADENLHSAANFIAQEKNDETAPEDITNLSASHKARMTDYLVTLKWTPSIDSEGDLDNQQLYRTKDKGHWGNSRSLGKTATKATSAEKPNTEVHYKITTKDLVGNESTGAIRTVKLPDLLPQTGSGVLIIGGAAMALAGVRQFWKKR